MRDWVAWHGAYADPDSSLSARLRQVQAQLGRAFDRAPDGPLSLVSLCAGQGHDILGVLPTHRRRADVTAVLVENDATNVAFARDQVAAAGLTHVQIRDRDASHVATFADALPADVLLLCGIFGNIDDDDIARTVSASASLVRPGSTVIWTRHRRPPDLTPHIRRWFAEAGFDEVAFAAPDTSTLTGVGAHRLSRPPSTPPPDEPLFTFRTD